MNPVRNAIVFAVEILFHTLKDKYLITLTHDMDLYHNRLEALSGFQDWLYRELRK